MHLVLHTDLRPAGALASHTLCVERFCCLPPGDLWLIRASLSGLLSVPNALPGLYDLLSLLPLAEKDEDWPIGHFQNADLPEDSADLGRHLDTACGPLAHDRVQQPTMLGDSPGSPTYRTRPPGCANLA